MTKQKGENRSRRSVLRGSAVALTATLPVSMSASASDSTPLRGGIISNTLEPESFDWRSFARGFSRRYASGYGMPEDVKTLADRVRNEFVANEDEWIDYGNWLLDESDAAAVGSVEIGVDVSITRTRWPTRNETEETVIETSYNDSTDEFESIDWRLDSPEDPDYQVEIRNTAAENAADELQHYRREHIDTEHGHEFPDDSYVSEIAGRYAFSIGFGDETRSVLEMLMGEIDD